MMANVVNVLCLLSCVHGVAQVPHSAPPTLRPPSGHSSSRGADPHPASGDRQQHGRDPVMAGAKPPPPAPVPLDFVPEFSYRARVVALEPLPADLASVRTEFEWGWGQNAGETKAIGGWGEVKNFTRNGTAAKWAKSYPNTYGLRPQYFTGKHEDDQILVTHLFVCHIGLLPSHNASLRDPNQTTTIEVEVSLDQVAPFTLGGVLVWGGKEGYCDDLGIVVGQHKSTGVHFVETFAQYNQRHYWQSFDSLPTKPSSALPSRFAIMDSFRTEDGDISASRDALRASAKLGLRGLAFSGPAWLQREELGYALTSGGGEVALTSWAPCAPNIGSRKLEANLSAWAASVATGATSRGFKRSEVTVSPIHDEPGMSIPRDLPPVGNESFAAVSAEWVTYLRDTCGLTPALLGAKSWAEVLPSTVGGMPGASLEMRRLYYHSLRYVSWSSSRYIAQATKDLEAELEPGAAMFVNWNNMAAHWYYPSTNPAAVPPNPASGQLNHDWFEFARERGATMLWTEDWFADGMSWQWSYYASLMSSACRLAIPHGGTADFGGYVVPRSSGGRVEGALLRRVISLIGGGAKAVTYFTFGPEYVFPGNCDSESPNLQTILQEQLQAHTLIGAAEDVLWPARRVASRVAILAHRSSNAWDPTGTAKWENQTEQTMSYQADQFGLYLALAVHANIQTDFLDEDAVLNATLLASYDVVFVTQPNVPSSVIPKLEDFAKAGGTLVLSAGAAQLNEYNQSDGTLSAVTGSAMSAFPRRVLHEVRQLSGPSPLPFAAEGFFTGGEGFAAYGGVSAFTTVSPASKTLCTFADKQSAAAVETAVGSGRIVQLAWQPGLSYLINATQEFEIPNPVTQFPAGVRGFLSGLLGNVPSAVAVTSNGEVVVGVETVLLMSDVGAVVTVVNWGGVAKDATISLSVNLPAAGFASALELGKVVDAASGGTLQPTVKEGAVTVETEAALANFVVFHRKKAAIPRVLV